MLIDEAGYRAVVKRCDDAMKELPTLEDLRYVLTLINRASQVGFLFASGAENLVDQKRVVEAAIAARKKLDHVES